MKTALKAEQVKRNVFREHLQNEDVNCSQNSDANIQSISTTVPFCDTYIPSKNFLMSLFFTVVDCWMRAAEKEYHPKINCTSTLTRGRHAFIATQEVSAICKVIVPIYSVNQIYFTCNTGTTSKSIP